MLVFILKPFTIGFGGFFFQWFYKVNNGTVFHFFTVQALLTGSFDLPQHYVDKQIYWWNCTFLKTHLALNTQVTFFTLKVTILRCISLYEILGNIFTGPPHLRWNWALCDTWRKMIFDTPDLKEIKCYATHTASHDITRQHRDSCQQPCYMV